MRGFSLILLSFLLLCYSAPAGAQKPGTVNGTVAAGKFKVNLKYAVGFWDESEKVLKVYLMTRMPTATERGRIGKMRDMYFSEVESVPQIKMLIRLKDSRSGSLTLKNLDDASMDFERFPPDPSSWTRNGESAHMKKLSGSLGMRKISGHYQGTQSWSAGMKLPVYQWDFTFHNVDILKAVKMGEQVPLR